MSIIIPSPIVPAYTSPAPGPVAQTLKVGNAVRDLGNNAETQMSKAHAIAVEQAKLKFDTDQSQYDKDFKAASLKANDAERLIGHARNQKIRAITSLVLNILAVVGVVIAVAATGTWPIAFAAMPFLIGMVPSSYYTDIFRKLTDKLEQDIEAPSKLKKPLLSLPVYNPNRDLELQQSRLNVQNTLSVMPLEKVANSGWSNDEIVNYALLDRATKLEDNQRPAFYAKCIQLINAYRTIGNEHSRFVGRAERQYAAMDLELRNWKRKEDESIEWQWSSIRSQERSQDRSFDRSVRHGKVPLAPMVGGIFTAISRSELESRERGVNKTFYAQEAQVRSWYQTTLAALNMAYSQVLANIEGQFAAAKTVPAGL